MKISELLSEGLSPVLFHYTHGASALSILQSGVFKLSDSDNETTRDSQRSDNEPPYYLSTSRSVTGQYHMNGSQLRRVNHGTHVMFDLDGRFYAHHHKGGQITTPMDNDDDDDTLWENQQAARGEAEDRIWSNNPTLSIGGVTSIHVYTRPVQSKELEYDDVADLDEFTTNMIHLARQRQIPIFVYNDPQRWMAQRHGKKF